MIHVVYKTTNVVNGKIYVGKHSTENIDDSYLGSGTALKSAIAKYGISSFVRTIISTHDSESDAYLAESIIVDREFVNRDDVYNIKTGGLGMSSHIMKERWHDSEYRNRMAIMSSQIASDPVIQARRSAASKKYFSCPKVRERHASRIKSGFTTEGRQRAIKSAITSNARPEVKQHKRNLMRERNADPEFAKRNSDTSKAQWQDPEYVRKVKQSRKEYLNSPEAKIKKSKQMSKRWADPQAKQQMLDKRKASRKAKIDAGWASISRLGVRGSSKLVDPKYIQDYLEQGYIINETDFSIKR